jgi:hypothetical protein
VFYKALGWAAWKAIRYYVDKKLPKRTVAAGVVLLGIAALTAAAAAAKAHDSQS